jgi:electron transport complex protein RnfA
MDTVKEFILLFVGAAFVNNVVLSQFLGICPFLGVSKKTNTAVGMGTAVIFVVTASSAVASLLHNYVLVRAGLEYMDTIVFIAVIAALVQLVEMILKKFIPSLYKALGVYLPLITTNCCVLGVALINVTKEYDLGRSVINALGTSTGFCVAIVLLAGVRERIEGNEIPHTMKGSPILLVTAGLMAIAFCGFAGLI